MCEDFFRECPEVRQNTTGFLQWEYQRLRDLVGTPNSTYYYNWGLQGSCESARGASSTQFCLAVMYGHPDNCTLGRGGDSNLYLKWAKKRCLKRYVRPLKTILDAFNRQGALPSRWTMCEPPCADEDTRRNAKVVVQYYAAVLMSWFTRVLTLLECKMKGHDSSMPRGRCS